MKILAVILLLFLPIVTAAQDYQGMNEEDMQQQMQQMQQMQEMQSCMQNVDHAKLKVLEQRSYEIEAEIKSLCANGQRDKAEKKSISFGMEMAKDPAIQAMRKCSEKMAGMMPNMPYMGRDKDSSGQHVCD